MVDHIQGVDVTCIDISKKMINEVQKKLYQEQIFYINFICADIMSYRPILKYDVVFANFFLNTFNWSDCQKVLHHLSSFVNEDGLLCIADETIGEKWYVKMIQTLLRPIIVFFHYLWTGHPSHHIFDYDLIILNLGFVKKQEVRDKCGYILSTIYQKRRI